MSTIFKTWLNWPEEGPDTEVNNEPSETQPDMVMSLNELLERARGGREVPTFNPQWDEDEDDFTPDPRTLDFVDFDTALEQNKNNIDELKEKAEGLKKKRTASSPKQQSDEGATSEAEGSQADQSASAK